MQVGILGGGSAGMSLAVQLADKADLAIWEIKEERTQLIQAGKHDLLHEVKLPSNLKASTDVEEVVRDSDLLIMAVPSHAVRDTCHKIKDLVKEGTPIVCISKGFDPESQQLLYSVIRELIPQSRPAVFSGPTHAEELAQERYAGAVIASEDQQLNQELKDLFSSTTLRVETNRDPLGTQIAAALKNPVAIFMGMVDGLKLGDNARAFFFHRGFQEIKQLGQALGADEEVFHGLAGLGDLLATCNSGHSRNWTFGYKLGQGLDPTSAKEEMKMVVEGINATKLAQKEAERNQISLNLFSNLHQVLEGEKSPEDAVDDVIKEN